ncbi:hypothetical protein vseg_005259 [Gypsophila vaccaria]
MEGSSPLVNLLCNEDQACVNENKSVDEVKLKSDIEYDDAYFTNLVEKELKFESSYLSSFVTVSYPYWLIDPRLEAVKWIFDTQRLLNYKNQTAYLSLAYFDFFLSIRCIHEGKRWAIRLLSVACLSLAAKMEECKVAALSEYPISDLGFGCDAIKRMELLVLSTFKWKMILVTPFAYLHYFIKKLCDQTVELDHLLSKAVELVMASAQETRLTEYRPSMIAATAVLAAFDWQMSKQTLMLKLTSVALWETSDNQQEQQLLSCYSLMQRLSTKGNISTPHLTEVDQTLDKTPSVVGTKRSLTFTDSDQNPSSRNKFSHDPLE